MHYQANTGVLGFKTDEDANLWREGLRLATITLSLSYLLFIVDDTPRFFFGDSAVYLSTRLNGYLPLDRSWTYGLAIHWLMTVTGSLSSVLLLQGALHAVALGVIGAALKYETGFPLAGFIFCVLGILDPLALYYGRAILTDMPGTSFLLLSLFFLYRLLARPLVLQISAVANLLGLVFSAAVTVSLRTAYWPALIGLCLVCLLLAVVAASHYRSSWPTVTPLAAVTASAAIVASIVSVLTINWFANPNLGFSLNRSSNDFMLGVLAPAVRRSILAEEGFQFDEARFREFHLTDINARATQIFWPTGLIPALKERMAGLSVEESEARVGRLVKRIVTENPTAVAKIMWQQLLMNLDFRSYLYHFSELLWLDHRIFDDGFVERHVHPKAWQKIDKALPGQVTLSEIVVRNAGPLVWLQHLIALLAPLGLLNRLLRRSVLYMLFALTASGYAATTIFFSVGTIPRYFLPLFPLSLAIVMLVLSAVARRHSTPGQMSGRPRRRVKNGPSSEATVVRETP